MAVHLRLFRMGKKKQPAYRIVAADSRRARNGRFLEVIGTYNPIERPAKVTLVEEKVTKWLDTGAVPSDTVASLLTQVGFTEKREKARRGEDVSAMELKATISERKKKTRKIKKAALAAAEAETAPATIEAAPAEEEKPAEPSAE